MEVNYSQTLSHKRFLATLENEGFLRANAKALTIQNRHFVIGGFSLSGLENDIHELTITKSQSGEYRIKSKQLNLKNANLFSPRQSFAACAAQDFIYIYGGIFQNSVPLNEFLEINIKTSSVKKIVANGEAPPALNSAALVYNQLEDTIVLYGGTDENLRSFSKSVYIYRRGSNTWQKKQVTAPCYEKGLWQHTLHFSPKIVKLSSKRLNAAAKASAQAGKIIKLDLGINEGAIEPEMHNIKKVNLGENEELPPIEGEELNVTQNTTVLTAPPTQSADSNHQTPAGVIIIVGGCATPDDPYPLVTQICLKTGNIVSQITINPIVGHDSALANDAVFVVGGTDGSSLAEGLMIVSLKGLKVQSGLESVSPGLLRVDGYVMVVGGFDAKNNTISKSVTLISQKQE